VINVKLQVIETTLLVNFHLYVYQNDASIRRL